MQELQEVMQIHEEKKMKKIYIAGPVTGLDIVVVRRAFTQAEERIAYRGDIPVNPLRLCSTEWAHGRCMRARIKALMDCNGIHMLKGWRVDRDAKLEHFIALKLGMSVEVER
jgi:hypothetical protein